MKKFLFMLPVVAVISFPMVVSTGPVQAQSSFDSGYEVRDGVWDLFVDSRGRRFLVDPDTSEIIGRANRNARMTEGQRRRAQRELRRTMRRARLERDLDNSFGLFDNRERRFDDAIEYESRRYNEDDSVRRRDRGREQILTDPVQPRDLDAPSTQELVRLPDVEQQPLPNIEAVTGVPKPAYDRRQMTELQVFLDREGFSPGVIDGQWGSNVAKAVASWKQAKGSDKDLGNANVLQGLLAQSGGEALVSHTLTQEDVSGPFIASVPVDYALKARLPALSYTSVTEKLAEKFHMSEAYLKALNPTADFSRAGTVISVVKPGEKISTKIHYIVADKSKKQVRTYDRNGGLITAYPATIGSASTPSPSGTHSVKRIAINPEYTYNPKINFTQGNNTKVLRIPPGPNGPVGSVWIALSKATYGIHGTPNPSTIGKTNSHGCIRLTNWDALELAKLVREGVTVEFKE